MPENNEDFIDIIQKTKYNIITSWGVRDSRYFEPTIINWDSKSTGLCPASLEGYLLEWTTEACVRLPT